MLFAVAKLNLAFARYYSLSPLMLHLLAFAKEIKALSLEINLHSLNKFIHWLLVKRFRCQKNTGQDYFCDPVFRITSPDVITSSDVQIHPLRIDIDLSRFVLVGREFFNRTRIFWILPWLNARHPGKILNGRNARYESLGIL